MWDPVLMLAEIFLEELPVSILLVTMKTLLGRLVVLATVVTSCNTQCYVTLLEGFLEYSLDECKDSEGVTHPLYAKWMDMKTCSECICEEGKIHCCSRAPVPVDYDKNKCKKIFHKENCTYTVVEQENPEKACKVTSWIL